MSKRSTAPQSSNATEAAAAQCVGLEGSEITPLDGDSLAALIAFFRALDDWDREANLQ
jgi:hypothetical protein